MRCIAQTVADEQTFWVKLHGGKVKSTFNYRKHIDSMNQKVLTKDESKNMDRIADSLLRKQEAIGRKRTGN